MVDKQKSFVTIDSMEIKKLAICTATRQSEISKTLLWQSVYDIGSDADVLFVTDNKEPLAKVYNKLLEEVREGDYDAAIFVHDDVILEHDPTPNLEKYFDEYDVIGVAGCSRAEIKEPALWHIMGGGFYNGKEPCNLHGAVGHTHKVYPSSGVGMVEKKKAITNFGYYPHRVIMIDGVFMALNKKAIETTSFDEDCPSKWHFYDLNFSMDANSKKLKLGVTGIIITHDSPGLSEITEDWKVGQDYFINKYGK